MKKILFLIAFFLLASANSWLATGDAAALSSQAVALHDDYDGTDMPLGDGEENSGEEDKDVSEDDDEVGLGHRWMSRDKSVNADLHILYQEILFNDLEIEVIIPPPKA